ncbi:MAG: hypothetical protein HOJ07_16850 [Rhodospirillaceae bacterium]|jgi:hypothetical protein|nr:hypothetical protein [Rhodospirillaceae bacterium]MBT5779790.1 hypothetical protein [Rhodospirillaceae bacterium]MBT7292818.1 hypothetical protein [Rhodospirillaceae bacterium]
MKRRLRNKTLCGGAFARAPESAAYHANALDPETNHPHIFRGAGGGKGSDKDGGKDGGKGISKGGGSVLLRIFFALLHLVLAPTKKRPQSTPVGPNSHGGASQGANQQGGK